ncbi:MAG: N-acetyltransferase [Opitutaceae bacterium]|nr:N-acetyltransferase [Opitutaceae bacterium]
MNPLAPLPPELGPHAEIAPNVILGYRYPGCRNPTRIGSHARIHSGTVIYADTVIGDRFSCGHNVTIRAECEIGDRVVILHGCTLEGRLVIGKGVKIMAHVYLPSRTVIGSMVFIGPGTTFLNARLPMREAGVKGPTIGNHVVIGGGVTLCPGIKIGDNAFIGAGSTVVKDVPANTLAYGTPARYRPLPANLGRRNDPQQIFCGLDLWDNRPADQNWRDEEFPGREEWLAEQ